MKTLKKLAAGTKFQLQNDNKIYIVTRNEMANPNATKYENSMFYMNTKNGKLTEIFNYNIGRSKSDSWNRCLQEVKVL